jgi:hypothetical protein
MEPFASPKAMISLPAVPFPAACALGGLSLLEEYVEPKRNYKPKKMNSITKIFQRLQRPCEWRLSRIARPDPLVARG